MKCEELLTINDLVVSFRDRNGGMTAVKGVSLSIAPGETLALVGESGCGKTVLCKSMLGFLCAKGRIDRGSLSFEGQDLAGLSERQLTEYRGSGIAMIPQDPMTSLDPVRSVGEQIAEAIRIADRRRSRTAAGTAGVDTAGAGAAEDMADMPEHAAAGADEAVPVDDEGTEKDAEAAAPAGIPADGSVRSRAVRLMELVGIEDADRRYSQRPYQFSGGMRQRIVIAIALAGQPKLLLADEPTTALDEKTQEGILSLIKDIQKKTGVSILFITHDLSLVEEMADRLAIMKDGRLVEEGEVSRVFEKPEHPYTKQLLGYLDYRRHRGHDHMKGASSDTAVLRVSHLYKSYGSRSVLRDVCLTLHEGEIVGLTGRSGCGKSTLARCIMGIEPFDGGEIRADRDRMQMIFQDSQDVFNARMRIADIIAEPLVIRRVRKQIRETVMSVMDEVGLDRELAGRRPSQLSGGQRQRAAIARALISDPSVIIADEPLTGLDVTAQAKIVHLFRELVDRRGVALLLIAHDRPMVEHVSSRIIDMEENLILSS